MSELRHVKGLSELNKFLQELPVKAEKNVLRGALRAGAKPVAEEVVANIWVDSGEMRSGVKVSTSSKGGTVIAKVKLTGKHAFIGPWLEHGVAAHRIVAPKGGALAFAGGFFESADHPGIQPRPVFRPALDTRAQEAVVSAAQYMKGRLATKHGLDTSDVEIEAV